MQFTAQMIAPDTARATAPLLRQEFTLADGHGAPVAAELSATALGLCEVTVNGEPASEDLLTPGWSSYEWRLRYAQWDVAALLQPDRNVLGILLGHGWYSGHLGWSRNREVYGSERAGLAELRITFADGHVQVVATDDSWRSGPSDVVRDDLYDGQTIDARLRDTAWTRPAAALPGWSGTRVIDFDHTLLTRYVAPPVRRQEQVAPVAVTISPSGATLIDFGQNLVGWTRLTVQGEPGRAVRLRHAEVLEHGELGVRPLRAAKATDVLVLSGGEDVFEPTFTFHGFRYVEVTGYPGTQEQLSIAIRAVVIGSNLCRIGTFACSDPLLNRLHQNIVWGMRGNFLDVPTDCPQRDERLGWTGDIAAFAGTAAYLYDVDAFLTDWLLDLAAEQQHADGAIPLVVPDSVKYEDSTGMPPDAGAVPVMALWNDAACWVPWALWEAYGDRAVLEHQYESMSAYARRIIEHLSERDLLERGFQFADWLDPTAPPDDPAAGASDPHVIATACIYRSLRIAADTAALLDRSADALEFAAAAARVRHAFNRHHVSGGRITSDSTAVYTLAIAFELLDPADRQEAGDRLAELVAASGHVITTGFAATPFISRALSDTGHLDTAYRLLLQTDCPSWLYPVTMGATTVWERWDSMLPDGSINPGEMTSFNHYALGAVGSWMHEVVGGLSSLAPGYSHLLIAPRPGGGLTWAESVLETPHGIASVHWELHHGELIVDIEIPLGVTAVVRLPDADDQPLGSGRHTVRARIESDPILEGVAR